MTAKPTFVDPHTRGVLREQPHPTQESQLVRDAPRWGSLAALKELAPDRKSYGELLAALQDVQAIHRSLREAAGEQVSLQEQTVTLRRIVEALEASAPLEEVRGMIELADAATEAWLDSAAFKRDKLADRKPYRDDWRRLDREELLAAARDALVNLPKGRGGRPGGATADAIERDVAALLLDTIRQRMPSVTLEAIAADLDTWAELFDTVLNTTAPKPRGARRAIYERVIEEARCAGIPGLGKVSRGPLARLR